MSAYQVSDEQISAILQGVYGCTHVGTDVWKAQVDPTSYYFVMNAEAMHQQEADELMAENLRSVYKRYEGKKSVPTQPKWKVRVSRDAKPLPALVVLKLIDNLQYQSCECDDYKDSEAYRLLCNYRERLIPKLPGYMDAIWGL
ncbi:hypothetical protein QDY63_14620 [Pseudomonas brenneri]|uniref:hypothetical protein n=1 Tax=Pseudomonas brenneri TaxID=129817 RepID=UPI0025A04A58|nr:hypothetical protein [Pseudomonas brenneri]WJM94047.1 hypothetical protein QDY63_14620 [Pseudomonas brenneri]